MNQLPIILPYDRPISWREYCQFQEEGQTIAHQVCRENAVNLDPEIFTEMDLSQNETLLECAADTLGIPASEVYRAAFNGRIEWHRPTYHSGTCPIFARLDGREWILQPALKGFDNFNPAEFPVHPPAKSAAASLTTSKHAA